MDRHISQSKPKRDLFNERGEQTVTKHNILANYLEPWAKIMAKQSWVKKAYYVDAFAGAGEYESGEEGSPLIATKILANHQKHAFQFSCICIEKNRQRYEKLVASLQNYKDIIQVDPHRGEFLDVIDDVLRKIGKSPAFFFIDPEGFSGMDFDKVELILKQDHKEILVNFQYNAIQRWTGTANNLNSRDETKRAQALQLSQTFTKLFGTSKWIDFAHKPTSSEKKELELINLYANQIRANNSFVWPFKNRFPTRNMTYYYLVYATKNLTAFKIMKDVMFREKSRENFQMNLLEELDFDAFKNDLCKRYCGKESVEYNEILSYVLQHTQYTDTDLRKALDAINTQKKSNPIEKNNPFYDFSSIQCCENKSSNFLIRDSTNVQLLETERLREIKPDSPVIVTPRKNGITVHKHVLLNGAEKLLVQQVGDGSIIKRFDKTPLPNKQTDIICPHFLELKWAYGCPFDCAWCYLKGTFRFRPEKTKPVIKDFEKIALHTRRFLGEVTTPEILNTGEIADSLMWEGASEPFSKFIIPIFEEQNRHKVLFLTKSDNVRNLLEIHPHNQVIISFSLNADEVAKRWENRAPSVSRRLEAAQKLSEAGYEVRIRIDPMVPVSNWERHYTELVEQIFARFSPARITLGSLRGLQSTINGCTDKSWQEYLTEKSNWGKKVEFTARYVMYNTIINQLKQEFHYEEVALCKETTGMWAKLGMDYKRIKCNCVW